MLWLALVVGVGGLAGWFIFGTRWKRRIQLRRLSAQLGLKMQANDSAVKASGLLDTELLGRKGVRCQNVLRGEVRGAETLIFGYTSGRGHPPDPVAFFHLREKHLPPFELRPRTSSKDPQGLQFDSYSRFSEAYALTGNDEGALRGLFKENILSFFERSENQNWAVASSGEWMAVTFWPFGERPRPLNPKEVLGFVEDAKSVLFVLVGEESLGQRRRS